MKIAYYTLDEVNRYLVCRWVKGLGIEIVCPSGRALTAICQNVMSMILDLDFLPSNVAADWLQKMRTGQVEFPVMVHGHTISDADTSELRKQGIRVCRGRVRKAELTGWLADVGRYWPAQIG